jgi:hypothetical protein
VLALVNKKTHALWRESRDGSESVLALVDKKTHELLQGES